MKYYLAIKRKELLIHARWMNFKNMLKSLTQNSKIPFISGKKNQNTDYFEGNWGQGITGRDTRELFKVMTMMYHFIGI